MAGFSQSELTDIRAQFDQVRHVCVLRVSGVCGSKDSKLDADSKLHVLRCFNGILCAVAKS